MDCAVAVFKNYYKKTKGSDIVYHQFPKNPVRRSEWLAKIRRADKVNVEKARVCSIHFTKCCYNRDLEHELLGLPLRKKRALKEDAVPTLFLDPPEDHTEAEQSSTSFPADIFHPSRPTSWEESRKARGERAESRRIKKRALEHLQSISPKKKQRMVDAFTETVKDEMDAQLEALKKQNEEFRAENVKLRKEIGVLHTRLKSGDITVRKMGRKMQLQEIVSKKYITRKVNEDFDKLLSRMFTTRQVKFLRRGKTGKWDNETISKALILRAVSRKAYLHLRKNLHFPLPALSTLRRWTSSFNCNTGLLHSVIQMMREQLLGKSEREKYCIISFDEMNVDNRACYDQGTDQILGPYKNVQVVMVRGLCSNWKQVVYYAFDEALARPLLKDIIVKLEGIGAIVLAVTSDMGPKNMGLWKELGINEHVSSFVNPCSSQRKIWVLADFPHLLKLLRNHFLDDGIILPSGKEINRNILEKLLNSDSAEMRILPRLTEQRINCRGRDRQRVRLAAQVFSNHVSKAIEYVFPDETEAGEFFLLVNDVFDIFNSHLPQSSVLLKSGFGNYLRLQMKVLYKMSLVCKNMRVKGRKYLLPFQKGILLSIRSLKGLFSFLSSRNCRYILTARLNQDCLENFFSQIRGLGHFYDHPLPTEVKNRIKLLILGKNTENIPLSSRIVVEDSVTAESLMSSKLFDNLYEPEDLNKILQTDVANREITLVSSTENIEKSVENIKESVDVTTEGFKYLVGHIAFKARKYDNTLGRPYSSLEQGLSSKEIFSSASWIEVISRGGLLEPTPEWLEACKQFEVLFVTLHGYKLNMDPNIVKTFAELLKQKFPLYNIDVLKTFSRIRTLIRIRYINSKLKDNAAKERAAKKARKWQKSSL